MFVRRLKEICSHDDALVLLNMDRKIIVRTIFRSLATGQLERALSLKPGGFLTELHLVLGGEL